MLGGSGFNRMQRPKAIVCYICGQQYGTKSIGIHIPQCKSMFKKREKLKFKHERRRLPKPPPGYMERINGGGGVKSADIDVLNQTAFGHYNANLAACPNCGRTFNDSALKIHMRSCKGKGGGGRAMSRAGFGSRGGGGGGGGGGFGGYKIPKQPVYVLCYICGRKYGTKSIGIHIPQCESMWKKREALKDRRDRKAVPKPPPGWNSQPRTAADMDRLNDLANESYNNNLCKCPNCGRTFKEESFKIHQRSCKPGNEAKRVRRRPRNLPSMPNSRSPTSDSKASFSGSRSSLRGSDSKGSFRPASSPNGSQGSFQSRSNSRKGMSPQSRVRDSFESQGSESSMSRSADFQSPKSELSKRKRRIKHLESKRGQSPMELLREIASEGEVGGLTEGFLDCVTQEDFDALYNDQDAMVCLGRAVISKVKPEQKQQYNHQTEASNSATVCEPCPEEGSSPATASPATASPMQSPQEKRKPVSAKNQGGYSMPPEMGEYEEAVELNPCPNCGRKFRADVLKRHIASKVCYKKKRKVFKSSGARLGDFNRSEIRDAKRSGKSREAKVNAEKKKAKWKAQSDALREGMRQSRLVTKYIKEGKSLRNLPPPRTDPSNDTRVQCKFCNRKFNPDRIDQHKRICANLKNARKPLNRRKLRSRGF